MRYLDFLVKWNEKKWKKLNKIGIHYHYVISTLFFLLKVVISLTPSVLNFLTTNILKNIAAIDILINTFSWIKVIVLWL